MPTIGTFISPARSLHDAVDLVRTAESLGYGSAYVSHIAGRDSLSVLAACAGRTRRIALGTGVLPIHSRTPVATAQAAATVDELSGGRAILGLGISHRATVEAWYGQRIGDPLAEMREYVGAVRSILRGEEPPAGTERRWPTSFRFRGYEARAELPIYIAALEPEMLALAGEIADGAMLWLCDPSYVRDVVVAEVSRGRARAGKTLAGFQIVAAVPAAASSDRAAALARARSELVPYLSLPAFRSMLERSGHPGELAAHDAALAAGDRRGAKEALGETMMDSVGGFGAAGEVGDAIARYLDAGVTSACLAPIGGADLEATLAAGAEAIPSGDRRSSGP